MTKFIPLLVCLLGFSFARAETFKLTSQNIKPGSTINMDQVFNSFGCTGKNISPEMKWSGAPKDTKTFALTMYDPDAPTGSGFWHWTVFNIPADTTGLAANAGSGGELPKGAAQGRTDFGKPGYGGPCPPAGDKPHRYIFTLYALKDSVPLDQEASGALVGFYLHKMQLGTAKLEAKFGR